MSQKQIKIGVGVVILSDQGVVLGQKGPGGSYLAGSDAPPFLEGLWLIPGGGVEFGESLADAARREVYEETGLRVDIFKSLCVEEVIEHGEHYILHIFLAYAFTGQETITVGDDLVAACWFKPTEVEAISHDLTPVTRRALRRAGVLR